ncbi:MAG: DUF6788 family protein [Acidimicrobiales bacterium]
MVVLVHSGPLPGRCLSGRPYLPLGRSQAGDRHLKLPRRSGQPPQRRRCGKANCHCADGQSLHESVVLSYSEGRRTHFVMLPGAEVQAVREATQNFRAAKARLEAQANEGFAALVAKLKAPRATS